MCVAFPIGFGIGAVFGVTVFSGRRCFRFGDRDCTFGNGEIALQGTTADERKTLTRNTVARLA